MLGLIFWGALIVLAIGGIAKFALDYFKSSYRITWWEFGIAAAVLLAIVIPTTSWAGTKMAFSNNVTYHEFWGGFEVSVDRVVHRCHQSETDGGSTGGCVHTYNADQYSTQETYTVTVPDADGEGTHTETRCCKTVWHWRQVPYTDTETSWIIRTTLGDYTVGRNWLPDNPESHRIRPKYGDPMERLDTSLPTGTPQQWQDAHDRIQRGDPGPVTARMDYENYILASQHTVLRQNSASIERYKQADLLPRLNASVENFYYADRVYFVGTHPSGNWQFAANRFAAALGTDLQGDIHVVIVDANQINDPDDYSQALFAYWQSPEFGKDAIAKNGIMVVLGTRDGTTVDWARAGTGMPVGNEAMLIDIRNNLQGVELTPESIFGTPRGEPYVDTDGDTEFRIIHSDGALENIIWGEHQFQRVCMKCDDADDRGVGYNYLKSEIQPTSGQKAIILLVTALLGLIAWGICIALGAPLYNHIRTNFGLSSRGPGRGSWS